LVKVEKQLTSRPDSVALLFQRGNLLQQMGRSLEARNAYKELLDLDPSHVGAMNNLATLLVAAGNEMEARRLYTEAVAKHPDDTMSRVNFGALLIRAKEPKNAREHLEHALKIDPDLRQAHAGLAYALADLGEPEQARGHRRTAFQRQCVIPVAYRGEREPIVVLDLISATGGNARVNNFLSDRVFQRYLIVTEFYDCNTALPPHQLVVNAIGDADAAAEALVGAQSLVAHTAAPVINPPAAVLASGRCDVARRLSSEPGVITPQTMTWSRQVLAAPDAGSRLTHHGFEFPLLLRTPGFHGGEHFLRVESRNELPAALDKLPGSDLTVIQYLDARAPMARRASIAS